MNIELVLILPVYLNIASVNGGFVFEALQSFTMDLGRCFDSLSLSLYPYHRTSSLAWIPWLVWALLVLIAYVDGIFGVISDCLPSLLKWHRIWSFTYEETLFVYTSILTYLLSHLIMKRWQLIHQWVGCVFISYYHLIKSPLSQLILLNLHAIPRFTTASWFGENLSFLFER